ncbi:MAG: glycosyltransferase [archaeon]|jgi:hypothetical protein
MKKCAFFVHLKWNEITGSFTFFKNILEQNGYEVKEFQRVEWNETHHANIKELNEEKYDLAVFCQVLPPATYLRKLNCKNFVWLPMYDGTRGITLAKLKFIFYKGINLKLVCFSKKLYSELKHFFNCEYYQYFPKPGAKVTNYSKKKAFFWERVKRIDLEFIQNKVLDINQIDELTIRQHNDPFNQMEKKKILHEKIKVSHKWMPKKEYIKFTSKFNIFFAPRNKEGIGHSFLEPLSRGCVVVAPNDSTMNEYIEDTKTGYLYEFPKPKGKVNLSNLKEIGTNARKYMEKGYKEWKRKQKEMVKWITK